MLNNLYQHPNYQEWVTYDGSYSIKMNPGFDLYLRPKCAHSQRRFLFKELEKNELDFLKNYNFNDFVCFDIGANIGYFTKWLLSIKNIGSVHSFEPDPINFKILKKNTLNNSKSFINNVAISNKLGSISLYLNPVSSGENTIIFSPENESISVKCLTIDDYINSKNISKLDFLKIDIQGAEINAIEGGLIAIKNFRPMIYMEYTPEDVNVDPRIFQDYIIKMVSNFNFKIYCIIEGVSRILSKKDLKSYRGNIIINPKF